MIKSPKQIDNYIDGVYLAARYYVNLLSDQDLLIQFYSLNIIPDSVLGNFRDGMTYSDVFGTVLTTPAKVITKYPSIQWPHHQNRNSKKYQM